MRRLLLIMLTICLLAPMASAQVDIYGVTGAGPFFTQGEETVLGVFAGGNIPLYADSGFTVFNRTGYFYASGEAPDDIQGAASWMLAKKDVELIGVTWFVVGGGGYLWEIEGEEDNNQAAMKLEFGANIKGAFSVAVSFDHIPMGKDPDHGFLALNIDFFP